MSKNATKPKRPPAPLKQYQGEKPPAPAWFQKALAIDSDHGHVVVDDAKIQWKAWGKRGNPGLILVHGGVAHKDWWDSIGPFLANTRRVVAMDLSGMGDSDHRDIYEMDVYAREVMEAGKDGGAFDHSAPFLIGHSFGGFVSLTAASQYGDQLKGVGVLDSPIRPEKDQRRTTPPSRGGNSYATFETALERFRLLPEQPCKNAFLLDHIARKSLKPVKRPDDEDGWSWKFDVNLWVKLQYQRRDPETLAKSIKCPIALFRGAESVLVTDEIWEFMRETFGPETTMVSIPDAQHHLILDQPIAIAAALEVLTGPGWK